MSGTSKLVAGLALLLAVPAVATAADIDSVQGKVAQYTLTPKGDVDGLVLDDGTQIHLPAHFSASLVFIVRPGDLVSIEGRMHGPVLEARRVQNTASGQDLVNEGRREAEAAKPERVEGKIRFALHGPKGDLNGAVLEDGTVVHFPPDSAPADRIAPGGTLVASGIVHVTPMGRVVDVQQLD